MPKIPSDLTGLRVLVVEDNFLVAETIRDALEFFGCEVVGPAPNLEKSRILLDQSGLDGALLDVNLAGTLSFPIAVALRERGIPFLFLTGYDQDEVFPPEFKSVRRIGKPFDRHEVAAIAAATFRKRSA